MCQTHRVGEKLFVDYCDPTIPTVNPQTGELRNAQIFIAVLGASSYTYAEATWSQALPDWIGSHDRHGVSSTIITGQLPISKWHEVFGDPTLADAILDRLAHNAQKMKLKGESLRKKQAKIN